jgi:NitT/TauT family transport system substrate-binding protein
MSRGYDPGGSLRRAVLRVWVIAALATIPVWLGAQERELTVSGPPAAVSFPLVVLIEHGALDEWADTVRFIEWRDPDRIRALVLHGGADFVALPSNVAANLHNRGVDLRLVSLSTWGLLYVLSPEPGPLSLADLAGQELAVPFRGDMPDIVLAALLDQLPEDERPRIRYLASPMDAVQMLLMGRIDHALLSEPAASLARQRSASGLIGALSPELHRSIDLQELWGAVFERPPRIPQAGICVLGAPDRRLIERFVEAHRQALEWLLAHPERAAELIAPHFDLLTPEAIVEAIAHSRLQPLSALDARPELEFFYRLLARSSPGLIGGALPPDAFYWPHEPAD